MVCAKGVRPQGCDTIGNAFLAEVRPKSLLLHRFLQDGLQSSNDT